MITSRHCSFTFLNIFLNSMPSPYSAETATVCYDRTIHVRVHATAITHIQTCIHSNSIHVVTHTPHASVVIHTCTTYKSRILPSFDHSH